MRINLTPPPPPKKITNSCDIPWLFMLMKKGVKLCIGLIFSICIWSSYFNKQKASKLFHLNKVVNSS